MTKQGAVFTISVVADMYGVHPQTLRSYERAGLLNPSRSKGNTRLYAEPDLEQLDLILILTRELGVNLAGVEVILHMRTKMERMHNEVEELIEYLRTQFNVDSEFFQPRVREALMRVPPSNLVPVEKRGSKKT